MITMKRLSHINFTTHRKHENIPVIFFILVLAFLLFYSIFSTQLVFAAEADVGDAGSSYVSVYLDSQLLSFDVEPELIDGTTFVTMRQIFEALDSKVTWEAQYREVSAVRGDDQIRLRIGSDVAIHNNEVSVLPHTPYLRNGRTMVPLRYLSEALDCDVSWNGLQRRVDIRTKITPTGSGAPSDQPESGTSGKPADEDSNAMSGEKPSSSGEGPALSILGEPAQLTYNDAMKQTISASSACKQARLSLKQAQQQLDEFYDLYSLNYTISIMQTRKDLNLLTDWSERNVVVTEEQTAHSVKNAMDDISLKLIEIENQQAAVTYAKKVYRTDQLRLEAGAISQKTLDSSRENVTAAEKKLTALQDELDGLYITLNRLVGSDGYVTGYSVEYSVSYAPVGEVDLKKAFSEASQNDPYLWYLQNSVDNADFKLQTYEYNMGGKSYTLTQMDLTKARIDLNATKANLEKTLRSRYNQLLQLENSIDQLEDQKKTLGKNIDLLWTLYDAGLQTRQALEDALQSERNISYNLLSLKINHEHLKAIFEKPYLAPEYMTN